MKMQQLQTILNGIAPTALAESWDNVGLLVGNTDAKVRKALMCIDLTEAVLNQAIKRKADLVLSYHPPIFKPLKTVTDADTKSRIVLRAIENKIAIYSPHTALDAAVGGVNDWLCEPFGKGDRRPIESANIKAKKTYKISAFVPENCLDQVRSAMADAGAGQIGNYDQCSFIIPGIGTFLGNTNAKPTVGKAGQLEHVEELRLEMVLPASKLAAVLDALKTAHPYEEPAFDIYPLASEPFTQQQGMGRILTLDKPLSLNVCIARLKKHLGVKTLDIARATESKKTVIKKIGLCAGAGGSLLGPAGDIDLFITGEMRHHDVLAAVDQGTSVLLAGHTQTERPFLPRLKEMLIKEGAQKIDWIISDADAPPSAFG